MPDSDEDGDFLDEPNVDFEAKSMMDLELDDIMTRAQSEFTEDDWEWIDQTVDSMLESLGLDLHGSLGLEDIDLNTELEDLFTYLGVNDPDGSVSEEYVDNLTRL